MKTRRIRSAESRVPGSLALLALLASCAQRPPTHAYFALGLDGVPASHTAVEQVPPSTPPSSSGGSETKLPPLGSSGGASSGGVSAPTPPGTSVQLSTSGRYELDWAAGDTSGGLALGNDATDTQFRQVAGVVSAPDGTLYACDPLNNQLREIPASGTPSIACGDATGQPGFLADNIPAVAARLDTPLGLARDARTGVLYVCDSGNRRVRYFVPGDRIYTLAGGGGDASNTVSNALNADLGTTCGVALDANQNVYFTERDTGRVRRVDPNGGLTTLAKLGGGQLGPIAVAAAGDRVWIGDGDAIRLLVPGASPSLQVQPIESASGTTITGLAFDQVSTLYFSETTAGSLGDAGTLVRAIGVTASGQAITGRTPVTIAGTGLQSAQPQDYALPLSPLSDARSQLLASAGLCSLYIDLYAASNPSTLSGIIYLGNSYSDASGTADLGQIGRLVPAP